MPIATGIAKQLRYKKEGASSWGVIAGPTGGQQLRRVESNVDLKKNTYKSEEIRTDYQTADFRHGTRMVDGSISGELSPATYADFMSSAVRQAWQPVVTTGAVIVIALASTGTLTGTLTTTGTSFITLGFKIGDVVRASGFLTTGVSANNRNLYVTALTATVLTFTAIDGNTASAIGSKIAGDTVTVVQAGKKTFMPSTGHTNDSYSIEHFYADIAQSEVFTGCRVSSLGIKLPSTGIATIETAFMGKDVVVGTAAYFTSPAAITNTGVLAAVNGLVQIGGTTVGLVTNADVSIDAGMSSGEVIGSNSRPDIFAGNMEVTGNMTIYFTDATYRDVFLNETEVAVNFVFTTSSAANADFIAFSMPRVKVGGATKDDGEKGLSLTLPFTALLNTAAAAGGVNTLFTTLSIQDSQVA